MVAAGVVALCLVAYAKKEFSMPSAQPASSYPAHEEHKDEAVTVAVDPYDLADKAGIFTIPYRDAGFLPLFVVITNNGQGNDLGNFTSMGIDPTRKDTVVVKSMHHFRAAFEPIAREVVLADSKSLCSEHYTRDMFKKVRRPAWPLDPVA